VRPVRGLREAAHQQQSGGDQDEAGHEGHSQRHPAREPPGDRRDHEQHERERQQPQPGLGRGVAEALLQVDGEEEEQRIQGDRLREGDDGGAGEGREAEQRRREHRRLGTPLDGDERPGRDDRRGERAEDRDAHPSGLVAADQAERAEKARGAEAQETGEVEPARCWVA
jgi:hypothetical protein